MKAAVLLSGGMDSVTALHVCRSLHEIVLAVSFDYGSKHNVREIPMAARQAGLFGIEHVVIPLQFMNEHFDSVLLQSGGEVPEGHYEDQNMRQTVVPFRNGIMLAIAGGLAESRGAEGLVIAAHAGDHAIYPDCREDFMDAMGEALRLGTYAEIALLRPFIDLSKAEIVQQGADLGVDFRMTWSCYKGGKTHCGACATCVERREAFLLAGVADPTDYLSQAPLPPRP